uniref:Formate channel n=1 Tax=Porphyromonas gingivalis TaxID=837 RepID=Q9RHH3_PORGN|nr:formate channel [Porphyromonas gingivalis]
MDVEEADKECTADDISDGDGQQIVDHEAAPADGGPLQYAEWNIEHIGNGVFESHSHECHHRPPDTEHFARKVMSRKSQPDGQTNQPVGTDSPKKCYVKRQGGFVFRQMDDGTMPRIRIGEAGQMDKEIGKKESTDKVGHIDHRPELEWEEARDATFDGGRNQYGIIAGEYLGSGEHHKNQADGEHRPTQQFGQPRIGFCHLGKTFTYQQGQKASDSNVCSGHDAQPKYLIPCLGIFACSHAVGLFEYFFRISYHLALRSLYNWFC